MQNKLESIAVVNRQMMGVLTLLTDHDSYKDLESSSLGALLYMLLEQSSSIHKELRS